MKLGDIWTLVNSETYSKLHSAELKEQKLTDFIDEIGKFEKEVQKVKKCLDTLREKITKKHGEKKDLIEKELIEEFSKILDEKSSLKPFVTKETFNGNSFTLLDGKILKPFVIEK